MSPMHSTLSQSQLSRGRSLLVMSLAAGLAMGLATGMMGCDREDPAARALNKASGRIQAEGSALGARNPEEQAKAFTALAGEADQASSPTTAAASSLLAAQSHLSGAQSAMDAAGDRERESRQSVEAIRSQLATYVGRNAAADAAASFDPKPEQDRINEARVETTKTLEAARQKLSDLERQAAALVSQIKGKVAEADAKLAQYSTMMQSTAAMSATQADSVVEQANAIRRQGDAIRLEAAKLQAQADQFGPRIEEQRGVITQFSGRMEELAKAEVSLTARATASKQAAGDARADGTVSGNAIDKGVKDLEQFRGAEVSSAYDKAQRTLKAVVTAAQKSGNKEQGNALSGQAQLQLAALHQARAKGHAAFASLLDDLAKAKPSLAGASEYAAKAGEARKQAEEATKEYESARESAARAYRGVPGKAGESLRALADKLDKSQGEAAGASADAAAAAAPAASGTDGEIRAALEAMAAAAKEGRHLDLMAFVDLSGAGVIGKVISSQQRLDKAVKAKFNQDLLTLMGPMGEAMKQGANQQAAMQGFDPANLNPADAKITVEGPDSATISISDRPLTMKKVDGQWKIHSPEIEQSLGMRASNPQMSAAMESMAKAFDELAADVEGGKIADAQAFSQALMAKMMSMGGMGGPGGAGGQP